MRELFTFWTELDCRKFQEENAVVGCCNLTIRREAESLQVSLDGQPVFSFLPKIGEENAIAFAHILIATTCHRRKVVPCRSFWDRRIVVYAGSAGRTLREDFVVTRYISAEQRWEQPTSWDEEPI